MGGSYKTSMRQSDRLIVGDDGFLNIHNILLILLI